MPPFAAAPPPLSPQCDAAPSKHETSQIFAYLPLQLRQKWLNNS
jgi:hypothetical protein